MGSPRCLPAASQHAMSSPAENERRRPMEGVPAVARRSWPTSRSRRERALAGCEGRHLVVDRPDRHARVGPHADVHLADADDAAVGVEPHEPDGVRVSPAPDPALRLNQREVQERQFNVFDAHVHLSRSWTEEERPAAAPQSMADRSYSVEPAGRLARAPRRHDYESPPRGRGVGDRFQRGADGGDLADVLDPEGRSDAPAAYARGVHDAYSTYRW